MTTILSLVTAVIAVLIGIIGIQHSRSVRKDFNAAKQEAERSNYALNMLEKTRNAAEAARALADKELGDPPTPGVPKDFEDKR